MKKAVYIFTAILTLLIGVFSYYIYFLSIPVSVYEVKKVTTLEELDENPQQYISQKVLLRENLLVFKDRDTPFYYYLQGRKEKCSFLFDRDNVKHPQWRILATLNLTGTIKENEVQMIEQIAKRNSQNTSENGIYGAEVEITGYVRNLDKVDDYFFLSDMINNSFSIDVIDIKQVSSIRLLSYEEMNQAK